MKGWIALDIDGTITLDRYSVPPRVIAYLKNLHIQGWKIAFATGRAFVFARLALHQFDFPFLLLPQNGSVAIQMPSQTSLFKKYLHRDKIELIEEAFQGFDTDYLVYSGFENQDRCYWRPARFSLPDRDYIKELQNREKETWGSVDSFDWDLLSTFPLIKGFGPHDQMKMIAERLNRSNQFQVAHIRDPFHSSYTILLITDREASKGNSLKEIFHILGRGQKVIAAGDDENDQSLLEVADVKIAMAHAPSSLQQMAHLIAPPTADEGIIHALQMGIGI